MLKVVLISGSLRRGSVNSAALRAVRRIIVRMPRPAEAVTLPIGRVPFYDEDAERAGSAPAAQAARTLVAAADALVISTPSYNAALPGVLKNTLDRLSARRGRAPSTGKVVAVLSASPPGAGRPVRTTGPAVTSAAAAAGPSHLPARRGVTRAAPESVG
ncbi:NADPH-dependent FMN reductase, partial [Streptomyces stramineus]